MVIMKVEGKKHFFLETSKGPAEGEKARTLLPSYQASQTEPPLDKVYVIGSWGLQGINVELD